MTCNVKDVASLTYWSECQEQDFCDILVFGILHVKVKIHTFWLHFTCPPRCPPLIFPVTLTYWPDVKGRPELLWGSLPWCFWSTCLKLWGISLLQNQYMFGFYQQVQRKRAKSQQSFALHFSLVTNHGWFVIGPKLWFYVGFREGSCVGSQGWMRLYLSLHVSNLCNATMHVSWKHKKPLHQHL